MSSCHVTAVEWHNYQTLGWFAHVLVADSKHSICLLLASCGSASLKLLCCFAGEFKADLILFWLHNRTPADWKEGFISISGTASISVSVCALIVFSCVPSSPMGTDHIHLVSSLMKVPDSQTKPRVYASKPSSCHLPGIQMVQVYTSQHNALSLYTALFDMMCGSFVKSHHKSTLTERETSDSNSDATACVSS